MENRSGTLNHGSLGSSTREKRSHILLQGRLRNSVVLIAAAFLLAMLASPAFGSTYSMTVTTASSSYSGTQAISISGTVSPAPGPNTAVIVTIRNSGGAIADVNEVPVMTNGSYGWTSYPGANPYWTTGTFTVNATWGDSNGDSSSAVTTFSYSPTASTSSTSSSTSSTTASTSTSSTSGSGSVSSSSSISSSSSSSGSSGSSSSSSKSSTSSSSIVFSTPPPTSTYASSTTNTSSSLPKVSGGGTSLASLTYPIVAIVVIVIAALGLVMWRRKVASDYESQATATTTTAKR
jgi:hypothetical protein